VQLDLLNILIAAVWLINGLFCKVLDLVPRHRAIVARILGETHASVITKLIGFAEIGMTVWVLSGFYPRVNAATQILIVGLMNVLEYFLALDLLLFRRRNAVVAIVLKLVVLYRGFMY
jgi:hypothetical protein